MGPHLQDTLELWTESEQGVLPHHEVRAALRAIQHRIEPIDQQSIPYRVNTRVLNRSFEQAEAYAFAQ